MSAGPGPVDAARLSLDEAARALENFRREAGLASAADPPPAPGGAPRAAARDAALDEARALLRELSEELEREAARADSLAAEAAALRARGDELAAALDAARRRAQEAEAGAETARREAEEALRRQRDEAEEAALRERGAAAEALERASAESRSREAALRARGDELGEEIETSRLRAERAEREKLEAEEAARRETASAKQALDAAGAREAALRAQAAELRARLESLPDARRQGGDEAAAVRGELEAAQAVAASLRRELAELRAPPEPPPAEAAPAAATEAPAAPSEPGFSFPPIEPALEPGWERLLRLARPPVEAAYAHLRRLSAGPLAAGQSALLRLAASSLTQAEDALATVELALSDARPSGGPAPVLPLLETTLASWDAAFRKRGVAFLRELSRPLPEAAHDPAALRLILHHVLRNALEVLPGGARLTVRGVRGADGALRLEFLDDGPGFPAAWLERRFEPFAAPRRGHAGLGLAAVRRALRRWGGDAEASNGPDGRGARLLLSFAASEPETPRRA